jgi:cold shock CspA family protein/GTPase SAR1 family protein
VNLRHHSRMTYVPVDDELARCPQARYARFGCVGQEMNLDRSFEVAKALCADVSSRAMEIETEQDARVQIINRFLTEVLGWDYAEIKTETFSDAGYADYKISTGGRARLIVEAKRIGPVVLNTANPSMASYKVGGPALVGAMPGIKQAAAYCLSEGASYAALTNGITWIMFLPFPVAGIPYTEGTAFVFPDLDAVIKNFALFHDLASRDGVTKRLYDVHFAKASGLTDEIFEVLTAANQNEFIRLLPSSQLSTDLEPVFKEFFGNLSGNNDPEMLIECFVETRDSRYADASLEKIVRTISSSVSTLEYDAKSQLAREIDQAVESGRGETVVIVGNDGSGKSTFMERFFRSVLDSEVRERCAVVKIDVSKWPGDLSSLSGWLTSELKSGLQRLLFKEGMPSYDELQGLYWREYQSWMRGQYKPLYESDKSAFKVKFGDFLNSQISSDPYTYVIRVLEDVVKSRKMLPCLIFDNGDSFGFTFQEAVFQYSQAIRESVPFSFVVTPVKDRSFWRLSKTGSYQRYSSKVFYLPVPPTKEVLSKRVAFLRRKIETEKVERSYFLGKGIKLTLENVRGFAACLEEVFVNEDFVSRRLSWLANNNLDNCLKLAQSVILSPIFSVEDLVKSFIAYGARSQIRVDYRKFMQALLHGKYSAFQQEYSRFVWNVFAVSPNHPASPLLIIGILKMLIDRSTAEEVAVEGYVSVEQLMRYFVSAGVSEAAVDYSLAVLLDAGLVQPYDSSKDKLDSSERIAVSHSGRIHFEMAMIDTFFISDMAFATPIRSLDLVEALRRLRSEKMTAQKWRSAHRMFFEYLYAQDELLMRLPRDAIYDGQRQLRQELKARWIDQRGMQPSSDGAPPEIEREHFSQRSAVVLRYNAEKGYGFLDAGLNKDVFVHRTIFEQAGVDVVLEGDVVVCDIAPVPKGKLEAIAVHSVQRASNQSPPLSEAIHIDGVIEFWNAERGYGFVRAQNLPDDAYVSRKTDNGKFADQLGREVVVRATVVRGRFGKFVVSSIDSVGRPLEQSTSADFEVEDSSKLEHPSDKLALASGPAKDLVFQSPQSAGSKLSTLLPNPFASSDRR